MGILVSKWLIADCGLIRNDTRVLFRFLKIEQLIFRATPKLAETFSKLINRHVKVVAERGGAEDSICRAIECEVQTLEVRGHSR